MEGWLRKKSSLATTASCVAIMKLGEDLDGEAKHHQFLWNLKCRLDQLGFIIEGIGLVIYSLLIHAPSS